MATETINIVNRVSGVLTDYDSPPVLRDEVNAYGVRVSPAGTIIVASGTVMTKTATGSYTITVTGLTVGTTYKVAIERTYLGAKTWTYPTFLAADVSVTPTSPYFTWQQFVNRFGMKVISDASNKDTTVQTSPTARNVIPLGQPNWYAVQDAFDWATDELNARLSGGILSVPLDFTPNGGTVPKRIGRLAMVLAISDLMDMRMTGEANKARHAKTKMEKMLSDVYDELAGLRGGQGGFQLTEAAHATDATGSTTAAAVSLRDVTIARGGFRWVDGVCTYPVLL